MIKVPDQMRIIKHYGVQAQSLVQMEELAELAQAISKCQRASDKTQAREHLIEEMADVMIIIKQLFQIYDINDDDVQKVINSKTKRTIDRLLTS